MDNWTCYLLRSLDTNQTYIGSTNNPERRLNDHNSGKKSRKGAKRTRGQTWLPIIYLHGFTKNACLSFETGWKRLTYRRSNKRLTLINAMTGLNLAYTTDPKYNRILDLLYFLHHTTFINSKFKLNKTYDNILIQPPKITIEILLEPWIKDLPWPHFVDFY